MKCDTVYRAMRPEVWDQRGGVPVDGHEQGHEEVEGECMGKDEGYQELPTYVIVSTRRGQVARLHRAGGCWRVCLGGFAHEENFYGSDPPDGARFTDACKLCWPGGLPEADSSDDGDSTSTTSSTASGA